LLTIREDTHSFQVVQSHFDLHPKVNMSPTLNVVTALVVGASCADAFSHPSVFRGVQRRPESVANFSLYATTLEPTTVTSNKNGAVAKANRPNGGSSVDETSSMPDIAIPASKEHSPKSARTATRLDVRIHDIWYDLSGWRKAHPAGAHWIDYYNGRDATEVMDAFHSAEARKMYGRLPHSKSVPPNVPAVSATQRAFRALHGRLEEEGYWKRDMVHESTQLGLWASFVLGAVWATQQHYDILAVSMLGISMTAAGWLGHDYIHGVDLFANRLRNFASLAAGLTPTWWSDKHNKVRVLLTSMALAPLTLECSNSHVNKTTCHSASRPDKRKRCG
jgi:Cytochrome b5-like Heme/Steroid binding domain